MFDLLLMRPCLVDKKIFWMYHKMYIHVLLNPIILDDAVDESFFG